MVNWGKGENTPNIGLQNCRRRPSYPMFAYREKEEGIIKWAVRPIANNQFVKITGPIKFKDSK